MPQWEGAEEAEGGGGNDLNLWDFMDIRERSKVVGSLTLGQRREEGEGEGEGEIKLLNRVGPSEWGRIYEAPEGPCLAVAEKGLMLGINVMPGILLMRRSKSSATRGSIESDNVFPHGDAFFRGG